MTKEKFLSQASRISQDSFAIKHHRMGAYRNADKLYAESEAQIKQMFDFSFSSFRDWLSRKQIDPKQLRIAQVYYEYLATSSSLLDTEIQLVLTCNNQFYPIHIHGIAQTEKGWMFTKLEIGREIDADLVNTQAPSMPTIETEKLRVFAKQLLESTGKDSVGFCKMFTPQADDIQLFQNALQNAFYNKNRGKTDEPQSNKELVDRLAARISDGVAQSYTEMAELIAADTIKPAELELVGYSMTVATIKKIPFPVIERATIIAKHRDEYVRIRFIKFILINNRFIGGDIKDLIKIGNKY